MKNPFILLCILIFILSSCATIRNIRRVKPDDSWNIEKYLLEAQRFSNAGRYDRAIELLEEIYVKFPEENSMPIDYNIGFNLYKKKNNEKAIACFNKVIKDFENNKSFSEAQRLENQKYVVLSQVILQKMEQDINDRKDPYHIREDIEKNKKLKPQPE